MKLILIVPNILKIKLKPLLIKIEKKLKPFLNERG